MKRWFHWLVCSFGPWSVPFKRPYGYYDRQTRICSVCNRVEEKFVQ